MAKLASTHEKLATRLAEILLALNQGETLSPQSLAGRFKVSERTIFRDLNRFGSIIQRNLNGYYELVPEYRGKLQPKDLAALAHIVGVGELFPGNTPRLWVALLDTLSHSSFLVKGHQYEQLKPKAPAFDLLDQAIREQHLCHCSYRQKERLLAPYRLINMRGIWYLAATEEGQLKAFSFSRIAHLNITKTRFTPDPGIQTRIENENDIWFTQEKIEVILNIAPEIAYYFERRKLLPFQETIRNLENGGLLLRCQINHTEQLLPQIRFWIPRIRIVEPDWLKNRLEEELQAYLQGQK